MPRLPEGPLGFPMPDRAAQALDAILRRLPANDDHSYRHALITRSPTELNPGERSDVSWISTESVDRVGDVVVARGMDDTQFRLNPLVTLGHDYDLPAVGRSAWRRRVSDGPLVGIKAKTVYPPRPDAWPEGEPWVPDQVFALVQSGLLVGKSIGFLPLRLHSPDDRERQRNGWDDVRLVIDEWLLLEYACVSLPANQDALVEAVSKGHLSLPALRALGLDANPVTPFTAMDEVASAVARRLTGIDFDAIVRQSMANAFDRASGRI